MSARLPAKTLVSALLRRVDQAGGFATLLSRGEDMGGMILIQALDKGQFYGFLERMTDLDGKSTLLRCGPALDSDSLTITDYVANRIRNDPDLWVIELDIPDAERFAAETMGLS